MQQRACFTLSTTLFKHAYCIYVTKSVMRHKFVPHYTFGNTGIICMFARKCGKSETSSFAFLCMQLARTGNFLAESNFTNNAAVANMSLGSFPSLCCSRGKKAGVRLPCTSVSFELRVIQDRNILKLGILTGSASIRSLGSLDSTNHVHFTCTSPDDVSSKGSH